MGSSNNIYLSKLISVFSIILIGALGSGLWDVFLKDFLFTLGNLFVSLWSSVYSGYIDGLYKNVGKASGFLLYLPSLLIIVFIIMSPIFAFVLFSGKFREIDIESEKRVKSNAILFKFVLFIANNRQKGYLIIIGPIFLVSVTYVHLLISEVAQISAVNQIDRRLEIIRPLINEQRYYELRSEYRLVDEKVKLVSLLTSIEHIAIKNNKVLPEIKLFGIVLPNTKIQSTASVGD